MRAFIAHSFSDYHDHSEVIARIESTMNSCGIEAFSFVKSYPPYDAGKEEKMMNDAFAELLRSDMLIAEVSSKQIGIGIEIGYARAKGLPIVYLHNASSEISKTVKGCAAYEISYADADDLASQLRDVVARLR